MNVVNVVMNNMIKFQIIFYDNSMTQFESVEFYTNNIKTIIHDNNRLNSLIVCIRVLIRDYHNKHVIVDNYCNINSELY